MEIKFRHKKLGTLANDPKKCRQKMGERRTTLLLKRLTDLQDVDNLEDLRHLPGRYHELKASRKGQWACDLDHPYRLVFAPQESPIPIDENGQCVWFEIVAVEIIEIVDYH
ncbi:killer suppression protein HigA, putative [Pedobacter sp. BAL39]|uniref:type II toxin-antitoxin system RelE/ParE family toxin n=1 Tax=Pedobacter sp. BAL39 TaxID=391596 RepID=UPI000155A804|nr:killer suppression protein HigA [Pedobacter sp. BAL39]EDM33950.1 killer suppression protein HigA, putative [Pedobacter sp. BAL39]